MNSCPYAPVREFIDSDIFKILKKIMALENFGLGIYIYKISIEIIYDHVCSVPKIYI